MSDTDATGAQPASSIEQLNTLWRVGEAEPAAPSSLPRRLPQSDPLAAAPASGDVQLGHRSVHQRIGPAARARDRRVQDRTRRCAAVSGGAGGARAADGSAASTAMRTEHDEIRTSLGVLQQATHNLGEASCPAFRPGELVNERRRQPDSEPTPPRVSPASRRSVTSTSASRTPFADRATTSRAGCATTCRSSPARPTSSTSAAAAASSSSCCARPASADAASI